MTTVRRPTLLKLLVVVLVLGLSVEAATHNHKFKAESVKDEAKKGDEHEKVKEVEGRNLTVEHQDDNKDNKTHGVKENEDPAAIFFRKLERALIHDLYTLENATTRLLNRTGAAVHNVVNDPCVRNGNSTVPAICAFLAGMIFLPLTRCCINWSCKRRALIRNRRLLKKDKQKRPVEDLNRLIEEANAENSDFDMF